MPISEYFKGKGSSVMEDMQKRYGAKRGKSMFYAVANKQGLSPKSPLGPKKKKKSLTDRMRDMNLTSKGKR